MKTQRTALVRAATSSPSDDFETPARRKRWTEVLLALAVTKVDESGEQAWSPFATEAHSL